MDGFRASAALATVVHPEVGVEREKGHIAGATNNRSGFPSIAISSADPE
jgi:hypothetical protein